MSLIFWLLWASLPGGRPVATLWQLRMVDIDSYSFLVIESLSDTFYDQLQIPGYQVRTGQNRKCSKLAQAEAPKVNGDTEIAVKCLDKTVSNSYTRPVPTESSDNELTTLNRDFVSANAR